MGGKGLKFDLQQESVGQLRCREEGASAADLWYPI